ncbi:MAG: protein-ADP-ribose hydrolase [Firmicutes bacterium]|nr:protein-ADP-ribose hydrolase [Bacillota bacterium]
MKQYENTDKLLEKLIEDSEEYNSITIPDGEANKRNLIRGLMNVRMPRAVSSELLDLQDKYLQEDLAAKGVVGLQDVRTIKDQYGSSFVYADKISLWQGDITRLKVGAIVNAANSQMLGCFIPGHRCIDNAIHSAAGLQLREECSHVMNKKRVRYGNQYKEPVGTATLTKAYNLPSDYVIHTVGPIVYGELTDSLQEELRNCYVNVLKCCEKNGITSVALCCISTGEFHFPAEEAARIAVQTAKDFLLRENNIERIVFNVFKDDDRKIYEKILKLV